LKKYILLFVLLCASTVLKAQSGFNYYEWGAGAGVSYMRGYDDLNKQYYHFGGNINVVYNYSPFLPIAAEFQFGTIEGGGRTPDLDKYGRYSKNNFKALVFHIDLQAGEIMDYNDNLFLNAIKNVYIGSGLGVIANNMQGKNIQRNNLYLDNGPTSYIFPGKNSSLNLLLPLRFGYEFKIFDSYDEPAYTISIGMQHNIVFGEGLDGYNDNSNKFKNNAIDQYTQFTIGFKYNFGNTVSYDKLIRNFRY